jgi:SAM-dependent methyltransferase
MSEKNNFKNDNDDKAGVIHWDGTYASWPVGIFNPHLKGIRYYGRKKWHAFFSNYLCFPIGQKNRLIEVGCGGSKYLPYFSKEFNLNVAGIDYSLEGCALAEKSLTSANVEGRIYHGDLFNQPIELIDEFDVAVSFGLVEHFADTTNAVANIAAFLKHEGLMITIVPNMVGLCGLVQKLICRSVYLVHEPLTKADLEVAHIKADLIIVKTGYLEFINFGVINVGTSSSRLIQIFRKVIHKFLLLFTVIVWIFEKIFGPAPGNAITSPYIFCIAKKR